MITRKRKYYLLLDSERTIIDCVTVLYDETHYIEYIGNIPNDVLSGNYYLNEDMQIIRRT